MINAAPRIVRSGIDRRQHFLQCFDSVIHELTKIRDRTLPVPWIRLSGVSRARIVVVCCCTLSIYRLRAVVHGNHLYLNSNLGCGSLFKQCAAIIQQSVRAVITYEVALSMRIEVMQSSRFWRQPKKSITWYSRQSLKDLYLLLPVFRVGWKWVPCNVIWNFSYHIHFQCHGFLPWRRLLIGLLNRMKVQLQFWR